MLASQKRGTQSETKGMCTVFHIYKADGKNIIGKNYDIKGGCPMSVFINKRGVLKTAVIKPPDIQATWKSRFGSVTFNAVGAEFPVCGMNENGLVIEQTTLWNTVYPDRDKRPAITELQWIQMMLDTCSSVEEVLCRQKEVRIAQAQSRLQFVVVDKNGERALIEHILGKCNVHSESSQTNFVIANDMLSTSNDYLAIHQGYGGTKSIARTGMSIDRFVVTKDAIEKGNQCLDVNGCFGLLELSRFSDTKWQVVYDISLSKLYFKTAGHDDPYMIEMAALEFQDKKHPGYMNIYHRNGFREITLNDNLSLMRDFFSDSYISQFMKAIDHDIIMANDGILKCYDS